MRVKRLALPTVILGGVVVVTAILLQGEDGARVRARSQPAGGGAREDAAGGNAPALPEAGPATPGSPAPVGTAETAAEAVTAAAEYRVEVGEEEEESGTTALVVEVRDESGEPFPGCSVRVEAKADTQWCQVATTDDRGRVAFSPAPPERIDLLCGAEDTAHLSSRLELVDRHRVTVYVRLPRNGVSVGGRLMDRRSVGLKDVRIALVRGATDFQLVQIHRTDAAGGFEFEHVSPGSYNLVAELSEGRSRRRVSRWIEVGTAPIADLALGVGYRSLHGTVRDAATGAELAYRVNATQPGRPLSLHVGGSAHGRGDYELLDLPPGAYWLRVSAAHHGTKVIRGITVREGEEQEFDVELGPEAVLNVKVLGGDPASPPTRAWVGLGDPGDRTYVAAGHLDDEGRFRFEELPAGVQSIWIEWEGIGTREAVVHLAPGENDLTMQLEPAGDG